MPTQNTTIATEKMSVVAAMITLIAFLVLNGLAGALAIAVFGRTWADDHFYYITVIVLALFLCVQLFFRAEILRRSRWDVQLRDIFIAVLPAVLIQVVTASLRPALFGHPMAPNAGAIVCIAILGPLGEEVLFRGIILRSLLSHMPRAIAVLLVCVLASLGHAIFWEALPRQIILSLVYLLTDYSLSASILSHVVLNSMIFFPLAELSQRWHFVTLCK